MPLKYKILIVIIKKKDSPYELSFLKLYLNQ